MIQDMYFQHSCEVNQYCNLYENRYINRHGETVADFMCCRIRNDKLYKYICAITSYDSLNSDNDFYDATGMFINQLLHLENYADAYSEVYQILHE